MGGVLAFLLCVVLQLTSAHEDCLKFLASEPQPIKSTFHGSKTHGFFAHFVTNDKDYELTNVIKFQVLNTVHESKDRTTLCVGFVDTTSYTKNTKTRSKDAIAWATMNTDPTIPTGIIEVDGECWLLQKDLVPCHPVFLPMPDVMNTPLYVHSPLSAEFWFLLKDDRLFARNWVWRMNTQSKEEKFPSSWVSNVMIRSLKELQIVGNDWKHVQTLLSPLPILGRLDLTDNNIEELAPDVLLNAPRLHDLLLARNNLSMFPQNLDRLDRLRLLDITNPKGNAELTISTTDLSTIKGVEIFGLENINLNANVTSLLGLQKMKFLNLSGCGIGHIADVVPETQAITDEKSFEILDLSNNKLTTLPTRLFSTLKKLTSLRLQRNMLEQCPVNILEHLHDLNYLDLSNNRITDVSKYCFRSIHQKLEYLDLSSNQIMLIPESTFQALQSLKTLKLSNNELYMLSPLTFQGRNTAIQMLDISHNFLLMWEVTSHIRRLNLSYNAITKYTQETFDILNKTEEVDLGGNPFDCCDENLPLLMDWMRNTKTDIKNLGTKDLLVCSTLDSNQKYPILTFKYEKELCTDNFISVLYDKNQDWSVTILVVIGVLISLMLILISVSLAFLKYYRSKEAFRKVVPLP